MTSVDPLSRGTGQRYDIFFQNAVAGEQFYNRAPDIVQETMDKVSVLTGRPLKLFEWIGD